MGSKVGNNKPSTLVWVGAALVLAGAAYLVMRSQAPEDVDTKVPPPRAGSPDLGPLDDKYIIGKDPNGPKTPGR
ncbi:MAG: hypothetical protein H0W86_08025 [Armatimonadetes bacterium]|nr:hypothetical protein [Armatimonadota bacterium]